MSVSCYFVTGASGFIGRQLCVRLRAQGHRVRGLVRRPDPALEALGVEVIRGDLTQPGAWREALAGSRFIIHCAAHASFGGGAQHAAANVDGTRALLAAAQPVAGFERFVFVSTIGAVDRAPGDACTVPLDENSAVHPTSAYGRSKRDAEALVRQSGLHFSIVRPALVVGRDMRADSHGAVFMRAALRGRPLARIAWPGAFGFVHVDDVAAALELCATHPAAEGRTFFCAGTPVALRDCFDLACPGGARLPAQWAASLARAMPAAIPFPLKALLLPALTASNAPLAQLDWQPSHDGRTALQEVAERERARLDPTLDPGGQTVITGAASGLGAALVDALAPIRRSLLLVDRDSEGLARIRQRHPHARVAVLDLADEAALREFVAGSAWREQPVRELYLCAGLGWRGTFLEVDAERHAQLFKVNVLARVLLAHAAATAMARTHFGRIVFISSSSAFQPLPFMASYAASNAALLSLGEAWAVEVAAQGVHILTVCPGGMQTNFQQAAGVKTNAAEKLMPPAEVAAAILQALRHQRTTLLVSLRSHAMAALARLLPRRLSVALWGRLMSRLR